MWVLEEEWALIIHICLYDGSMLDIEKQWTLQRQWTVLTRAFMD